jgi:hypothetical protein
MTAPNATTTTVALPAELARRAEPAASIVGLLQDAATLQVFGRARSWLLEREFT